MTFSIRNFFRRAKEVTTSWIPFYGGAGSRITSANLIEANKNWVYVCTDKIADATSSVALKLMKYDKNGMDTEVLSHKALDLLLRPNDYLSGRDFKYATLAHEELTGNAYWLKDKPKNPTMLFPLNPQFVTPKMSKDGQTIEVYTYRNGTKTVIYQPDMIFHLKYPNPRNMLIGMGTLEPIAEWVDVDNYATEFNRRFFMNGATFGGTIETDASTKEAMQLLRISLNEMYTGVQNSHKPMLLPKGTKMNESKMNARDMQFSEMDNRFRDKILAAFGVPKSVVGIVEDVNRANAESSNYVFMAFTVKPKLDRLITFLNEFYLPTFDGTDNLYFTYVDPTPQNVSQEVEENKAGLGGSPWLTVNEVRAKKGLPPVEGGDVVQSLLTLMPLGAPQGVDDPVEPDPAKSARKDVSGRVTRTNKTATAKDNVMSSIEKFALDSMKKGAIELSHKQFIARIGGYEAKFAKILRDFNIGQQRRVLDNISKHVKGAIKALTQAEILNVDEEADIIVDLATPLLTDMSKAEGQRALATLNITQTFDMTKRLQQIIDRSVARMADAYTKTTLEKLSEAINAGLKNGETLQQITNRVGVVYDEADSVRAERTSRTEVYSAANDASREAYIQSDVVKTVRWHTAEDELVCPFCVAMGNRDSIPVKDSFEPKGASVEGTNGEEYVLDYERLNNPPLHPNCRCLLLPDEISLLKEAPKPATKEADISEDDFWKGFMKILEDDDNDQ